MSPKLFDKKLIDRELQKRQKNEKFNCLEFIFNADE